MRIKPFPALESQVLMARDMQKEQFEVKRRRKGTGRAQKTENTERSQAVLEKQ